MKLLLVSLFLFAFPKCGSNGDSPDPSTKKFIQEYVPKGAKRIEYRDTHGGFHGDGELSAVYQLNDRESRAFEERLHTDPAWKELPV